MTRADGDSRERILTAASELFARRGYEGTSTRAIAAAAGLNLATVAYHVGSKRQLYRAVLAEVDGRERAALAGAFAGTSGTRAPAWHRVLDSYLDFCVEHPEVPALWTRRWLAEAAEVDAEVAYALPLYRAIERALAAADVPGDPHLVLRTLVWTIYGFVTGGVLDQDGVRRGVGDPVALAAFRAHLHRLAALLWDHR